MQPPASQSSRRVAHLTTVHKRNDIRIFKKECSSLSRHGWEVSLIVADGKGNETESGVRIYDVGKSHGRLSRMATAPIRVLRRALALDAAVYHFHDPELIPAALILRWKGKQVIYDVHEDVPRQILSKHWIQPTLRASVAKAFEWLEDFSARRFSAIVTATPHIADRFSLLNPHCLAINNFPLQEEIDLGINYRPPMRDRKANICYVGGITRMRGAVQMVQAMDHVDATLILAGPMESKGLEDQLRGMSGWAKVDYRGEVDRAGVRAIFNESRLGLLPFLPVPNHTSAQPNKMFEYMSAGIPFVASDFPLWRSILADADVALLANPEDPHSLASAVNQLLTNPARCQQMGQNGLDLVTTSYSWASEEKKLFHLYGQLSQA